MRSIVGFQSLTAREREVATALMEASSNREIAMVLGISTETVKRHLASIYSKLALPGRVALARYVVQAAVDAKATIRGHASS